MKGLLRKDFYTLTRQLKLYLVLVAVFACMPAYSMSAFAIVYAAMLPFTALAYDERAGWDVLAATMPLSRRQLVGSKYVLGLIACAAALLLSVAAEGIWALVDASHSLREGVEGLVTIAFLGPLMMSLTLPLMYRFGVEKGRLVFLGVVALFVVGGGLLMDVLPKGMTGTEMGWGTFLLVAYGGTALIGVGSLLLSERLYRAGRR